MCTIERVSLPTVPTPPAMGFYTAIGGEPTFRRIVGRFFEQVAHDPVLRAVYTDADLGPAEQRLRLFLMQYWGGPTTYSDERGHPRLRMRHVAWQVGVRERDAWLSHMLAAVTRLEVPDDARAAIWDHLERAAHSLVNWPPPGGGQTVSGPDLS